MINEIFTNVGAAVTAFSSALASSISSVTSMFYTNDGLTVLGTLVVITIGVGLVYWAFRLIKGLIRRA